MTLSPATQERSLRRRWLELHIAHRLNGPNGAFLGVIARRIDPANYEKFLASDKILDAKEKKEIEDKIEALLQKERDFAENSPMPRPITSVLLIGAALALIGCPQQSAPPAPAPPPAQGVYVPGFGPETLPAPPPPVSATGHLPPIRRRPRPPRAGGDRGS